MNREEAVAILRRHEPELRAAGVSSASLSGSKARGEAAPADVDVAVRLAENFSSGGFDYFYQLDELEKRLARLLGCKIDVVVEPVRKGPLQREIDRDRALGF